jgi:hypothetical protein
LGTVGKLKIRVGSRSITVSGAAVAVLFMSAACSQRPKRATAIGEAFAGPASLKIRSELSAQSPTVATVKHGDRLEILQRRRSIYRVRTASGAEGWTDERQLLAASDMANLKELAEVAAKMPSQGLAVPRYGDLRVYTLPSLSSPSFLTVAEKEKVHVLRHVEVPRVSTLRTPLLPPTPKKVPAKKKHDSGGFLLPPPKPPGPPPDWMELSRSSEPEQKPEPEQHEEKPVRVDNWSLIRTADGQTGWVRTRLLTMAIPDEVAQYAEGRRIVSYFSLGTVEDGADKKDIWLWTTMGNGPQPYDFDNFRVFIWNTHRHRYETAYIERNVHGFGPVLKQSVDYSMPGKSGLTAAPQKYPGFSLCVENSEGLRVRRQYALLTNIVRRAGEQPCAPPVPIDRFLTFSAAPRTPPSAPAPAAPQPAQSLTARVKQGFRAMAHRWFGK